MKKLILVLLIILGFVSISYAAGPYLVCDPQSGVSYYVVSGLPSGLDGSNIAPDSTNTYGFKMDISTWPSDGKTYTLIAFACDTNWGCSRGSVPLTLSRPSLGVPTNVKMSKQ